LLLKLRKLVESLLLSWTQSSRLRRGNNWGLRRGRRRCWGCRCWRRNLFEGAAVEACLKSTNCLRAKAAVSRDSEESLKCTGCTWAPGTVLINAEESLKCSSTCWAKVAIYSYSKSRLKCSLGPRPKVTVYCKTARCWCRVSKPWQNIFTDTVRVYKVDVNVWARGASCSRSALCATSVAQKFAFLYGSVSTVKPRAVKELHLVSWAIGKIKRNDVAA
jgi:hypothetical protein